MDSSHGFVGVTAASLAPVLVYLSHWPLQPLTLDTATSIATLLIGIAGFGYQIFKPANNGGAAP